MTPWTVLLLVLALAVVLLLAGFVHVTLNLLRTRVVRPEHVLRDADEVPETLKQALQPTIDALADEGLTFWSWTTSRAVAAGSDPGYAALLRDEAGLSVAVVMRASVPEKGRVAQAYLESAFADGGTLLTFDQPTRLLLPRAEGDVVRWSVTPGPAALVAAHGAGLGDACPPRTLASLSGGEWLARYDHEELRQLRIEEKAGRLVREPDGFRPSVGAAWRAAAAIVWRSFPTLRVASRHRSSSPPPLPVDPRVATQVPSTPVLVDAFRSFDEVWRRPLPQSFALRMFLATFAVSAAAAWWAFGPGPAGVLLAVLALHELGHLVAMLAFGYRNTRVFFVPFLGAAVSGDGAHATVLQRAVVLLAGPAPGLLLGASFFASGLAASGGPWFALSLALVGINGLNLLPFMPFDGGQLWNAVLFSRTPMLEVLFRGLAGVALLWLGSLGEPVALGFGLLMLAGLAVTHRRARLAAFLRGLPDDDAIRLTAAIDWLRREYPKQGVSALFAMLRGVRQVGVPEPASVAETAGVLAAWTALVVTLILALLRLPGVSAWLARG